MEDITLSPAYKMLLQGRDVVIKERDKLDKQIAEYDYLINLANKNKQVETYSTVSVAEVIVSDAILKSLQSRQVLMRNKDFVSCINGANPETVSKTLFRMKGKKVKATGDNNKDMKWGLIEWFDDNGNILDKYNAVNENNPMFAA